MNIISEKLKEEYQFHLFWNLQQLKEFSEKMPISRLLIAEEYPVEKRKEILAEQLSSTSARFIHTINFFLTFNQIG
jgi:hypothetical protein